MKTQFSENPDPGFYQCAHGISVTLPCKKCDEEIKNAEVQRVPMEDNGPKLRKLTFRQRLGLAIMLLVDGQPIIKAGEATFMSGFNFKEEDLKANEWTWLTAKVCIDWFGRTYVEHVSFCQGDVRGKKQFVGKLSNVKVNFE